ncbi:RNA procession exonuclease-like protein [Pseudopedobacter saltans DSM 12145]|uniref:RNA procession exonuclease-like protein n=1 Tax=Pseudopedobacter saltans (strain ATCC 51119 / DSM 12145 / JCM 21818 / CCUG 39354 / LMG 10337 / NBRC 100064 / NCIMB 13643) TaxID=762903 RepID=F0SAL1_PSESL|nr:MBL fold metallo-hydrolase [Pseudopedobacter saltans]ADY52631.1 RNA procession exonuclease-like protein [Pseudopedobacter saltans DSM 12145]
MIKDDFLVKTPEGLYCAYGDFYLDPELPVQNAVISHAHGDHARAGNANVYATAFTKELMLLRYKKKAAKEFFIKGYKQEFSLNNVKLSFYPAGHILGSAMVLMEFDGARYLYTGDYKMQEDSTCEKIELPLADVLITESTFANPKVKHPDATGEIKKLNAISSNILLGVYGLGKAQRITALINEFCPTKEVHVHYSIFPIHQLYNRFDVNIGKYSLYNRKSLKQNGENQIYLIPPLTFNSYRRAVGVARVFASGWEYLQQGNDLSLYISDHVDWEDILNTISIVKPTEVWTLHGDGNHLKVFLKEKVRTKIL